MQSVSPSSRWSAPGWLAASLAVLCVTGFLAELRLLAGEPGGLRVGVAKVDITPTQPVTLAGYASRNHPSQGVHDPLSARAVAFEQGGHRLVLVANDLIGFYGGTSAAIRQAIQQACGLKPAELFLAAIHTHSAPNLLLESTNAPNNVAYTKWLEGQLVQLVQQALSALAPARIGTGSGACPVGANRRQMVSDNLGNPSIVLGRNPGVMTDREVQVVKIVSGEGNQMSALLFDYPTHSTAMGPSNYLISGDVHGLAAQFLERYYANGTLAFPFAGASGDIDPWFRVRPEFKTTNGWVPEAVLLGTLLGEEVALVEGGIRQFTADGPVKSEFKTLELPGKPRNETKTTTAARPTSLSLTVGRVGSLAFVGLGGEVFNELGKAIKTASPFPMTLIITHCNGSVGYLPSQRAYLEGGYEVQSSGFGPTAAERVVQEAVRALNELYGD